MEKRVIAGLKELSFTLKKIQDLIAWRELEKSERKEKFEHSFQIRTSTEQDLKLLIGVFLNYSFAVHEALQTSPPAVQQKLTTRYRELQEQFRKLDLPQPL